MEHSNYWKNKLIRTCVNIEQTAQMPRIFLPIGSKNSPLPYPIELRIPECGYSILSGEEKEYVDSIIRKCDGAGTEIKYINENNN